MSEYIKREDAVDQFALYLIERDEDEKEDRIKEWQNTYTAEAHHVSELIPAADVEPVRHGHWIEKNTNKDGTHNIYCNECGKYIKAKGHANSWYVRHKLLYCPNCGAKMDDKEQEHGDTEER